MKDRKLSDDDIERILREYKEKTTSLSKNRDLSKNSSVKKLGLLTSKFTDAINYCFEMIYSKVAVYTQKHHSNPYIIEFLMGYGRCITVLLLALPLCLIIGIFENQILFTLIFWLFGLIFAFVLHTLTAPLINRTLLGILRDRFTGKKTIAEKISIENFTPKITSWMFGWANSIIDVFYPDEYDAVAANMFCKVLSDNATAKTLDSKKKFRLYDSDEIISAKALKKCRVYNLIMTRQKSDLLDRLIELEPTAAFEITYMKHSKILKKIAPIPGWEYADGVAELCDEISNMYP